MSVKTMHTNDVKELLDKVAGFEEAGGQERVKQILHRLMHDIFQIVEDFDVTPEELWSAVYYVGDLGQSGEAALAAPGLGIDRYLDIRMDAEDEQAGRDGGTPRTIEGPLYVAGAPLKDSYDRMDDGTDKEAETMILTGQVTDENGEALPGAVVDIWHADSKGAYSYFDPSQSEYNLRRRIRTDSNGIYKVRSIIPSGYGCPPEGPTQQLLNLVGRHGQRPAHIHFFISRPGYKHLTTQINLSDDDYTYDDFAFATRGELVRDAVKVDDPERIRAQGLEGPYKEVHFDVQLVATEDESLQTRHERPRAQETTSA